MNIAICDDDKYFCQVLKDKLLKKFHENCGEIVIVDIYTDSTVFINEGTQHNYQLVFLDIDMPNENGFSVADKIANTISDCYFVFVTSHDSLVFEAIKKHPFGFTGECQKIFKEGRRLIRHNPNIKSGGKTF